MFGDLGIVALGGALGASARYAASVFLSQRISHGFPWHTFVVNIVGAALLGLLMALEVEHHGWGRWQLFAGVGVLGGFTTFSTFSYETLRLMQDGMQGAAMLNAALSVAAGVAAAAVGIAIGRSL